MEKEIKKERPDADINSDTSRNLRKKQNRKAEPGPGGSQESDRNEYHEETSRKSTGRSYDHKPEKDLEE
jgi:hypothetical protein